MLDYWVDLMDLPVDVPDEVVLRTLAGADFIGPTETLSIEDTGLDASYPEFGFAFDRAAFDDWLREEAEAAGATYRVGDSVTGVDSAVSGPEGPTHTLELADGETVEADALILADGPQRTVTGPTLNQFLDTTLGERMPSTAVNHIAYQEHRRMPEEVFEPDRLKFWWGYMPGHTAYPWVFPNDGAVARVGLTMPIGLDIDDFDRSEWALLRGDDETVPGGSAYLQRLLAREYPGYDLGDFPLVEDRGKRGGTETYPISSTLPVESPTAANVAVVGGAMGATSAFHEGGDHVAVRTGRIAGRLAADGNLDRYNDAWQDAVGDEVLRNVTLADIVEPYRPDDWDQAFTAADTMLNRGEYSLWSLLRSGLTGLRMLRAYRKTKTRFADGAYVQLRESEYAV